MLSAGFDAAVFDLLTSTSLGSMRDATSNVLDRASKQLLADPEDILEVLHTGRTAKAQFARPSHTLLTIQLSGQTAAGESVQTSLSFIELAAPDTRCAAPIMLQGFASDNVRPCRLYPATN